MLLQIMFGERECMLQVDMISRSQKYNFIYSYKDWECWHLYFSEIVSRTTAHIYPEYKNEPLVPAAGVSLHFSISGSVILKSHSLSWRINLWSIKTPTLLSFIVVVMRIIHLMASCSSVGIIKNLREIYYSLPQIQNSLLLQHIPKYYTERQGMPPIYWKPCQESMSQRLPLISRWFLL